MPEQARGSDRKRALLGGKVASRDGSQVVSCTIRDLSDTGAKITVPAGIVIPTHVFLVYARSAYAHECQVSWIKPPQYGLKFINALPLDDTLPTKLNFLRRLGQ
jgi:hypothetical protein